MKESFQKKPGHSIPTAPNGFLQRKCACGGNAGLDGLCEDCRNQKMALHTRAPNDVAPRMLPTNSVEMRQARPESLTTGASKDLLGRDFSQARIYPNEFSNDRAGAALPGVENPVSKERFENDPIHRPIIEDYRRQHGLPEGGVDESGQAIGPSDAEIKYGQLAPSPSSVFYVSFVNAAPPATPDHSQSNPGPNRAGANRAGYTRVRNNKRMSIAWDNLPALNDGRLPLFAQSVNIFYRLDPIEVFVSSDYAERSCPYRVTLSHERSHVEAFTRIFHASRATLIAALASVSVPTRNSPIVVDPANVSQIQDEIGERLRQVIIQHTANLVQQLEADRDSKDSSTAYAAVHRQCPSNEW